MGSRAGHAEAAHFRRKIFDVHATKPRPLTTDLLQRIDALYEIETEVRGSRPIVDDEADRIAAGF